MANVQTETITKIQFRRGTTDERLSSAPANGEPGWDTTQQTLYIGDNNSWKPPINFAAEDNGQSPIVFNSDTGKVELSTKSGDWPASITGSIADSPQFAEKMATNITQVIQNDPETNYNLAPLAKATEHGTVKPGSGLKIVEEGVIQTDTTSVETTIKTGQSNFNFKAGVLHSESSIVSPTGDDDKSNDTQYYDETYVKTNDLHILETAHKYVNGILVGKICGPGIFFRHEEAILPDGYVRYERRLSKRNPPKSGEVTEPHIWLWNWAAENRPGNGNGLEWDAGYAFLSSVETSTETHNWGEWWWLQSEPTASDLNEGIWIWLASISQWIYTSMSLYPYVWLQKNGDNNQIQQPGTGGAWSYISSNLDGLWWFNFGSSTTNADTGTRKWYKHEAASTTNDTISEPSGPPAAPLTTVQTGNP